MKLLLLLLLPLMPVFAQVTGVERVEYIAGGAETVYFAPEFSPDGDALIFSGPGYSGLFSYNSQNKTVARISDKPGAGYEPVFSGDGKTVYFRIDEWRDGRRFSALMRSPVADPAPATVVPPVRGLSVPKSVKGAGIVVKESGRLFKADTPSGRVAPATASGAPAVFIENSDLVLYLNEDRIVLNPLGDGNYIWPSVSPDGSRILFTKTGDGTYVCGLDGEVLSSLGYANAPKWSPNGEQIMYMVDEDDGYRITASDLFVVNWDGAGRVRLTDTPDVVEVYPVWSPDAKQAAYATGLGEIHILHLETE